MESVSVSPTCKTTELLAQIQQLQRQVQTLKTENKELENDFEIMLETVTVHSTHLEQQLRDKNRDMQGYLQEVEKVTAAAAEVETGTFVSGSLEEVATRTDQLGQLARVFEAMVRQVESREQELKQKVKALTIEIDRVKQGEQVAQVVQSESFQTLKERVKQLRQARQARQTS